MRRSTKNEGAPKENWDVEKDIILLKESWLLRMT